MNRQNTIFGEPERKSSFFNVDRPINNTDFGRIPSDSGQSSKKAKKTHKNTNPNSDLKKRADRIAQDPFTTDTEKDITDEGSREKEQKVNETEDSRRTKQEESEERQKDLDVLASRADKVLLHAKTIFPFDFFGSTITIDANKVNIRIKTFFYTETVTSILLKEIMDVRVQASLFFGKLVIDYGPHPLRIKTVFVPSLRRSDALKAKEIIEGNLVLYRAENIDTTKLKPEETLDEIMEIGKVEERE